MHGCKWGAMFFILSGILGILVMFRNMWLWLRVGLFYLAFWPQVLLSLCGLQIHSSLVSVLVNGFGWTFLGFLFGVSWRRRSAGERAFI